MKRCGYCMHFKKFDYKPQYGTCKIGKSGYPDGGTFSTNSCPFFEHRKAAMLAKQVQSDSKAGKGNALSKY